MIFHVRLTLQEMHAKATRSVIAIGETVLIKEDGTQQILTSTIQRKYSEISYSLSQSDEEGDQKMKGADDEEGKSVSSEDSANMARNVDKGRIQSTRLRSKNVEQRVDNE
jgi:nucleosome binding factor SPN SPT16 subunit